MPNDFQASRWARFGSAALAFIAGTINAVGFLGFQHQGVTHLTGSTTLLGIAVGTGNLTDAFRLLAVIGSFLVGCVFSGFLIQDGTLKLGRHYGIALTLESALLFIAVPLLHRSDALGAYLASCACGLQNGMVSTYSGAVLRTTHVSGVITDLGIGLGQLFRGLAVDSRRMQLLLLVLGSFFSSAMAGTVGYFHYSYETLYFPAILTGCVGIGYSLYEHRHRRTQGAS